MSKLGNFFIIEPDKWLFPTHGDVLDGKRRALEYFSIHNTYEGAEFQIEEFVRQWALAQLINEYKYPKEWIGERLIIEEPVKMGSTEKEADISLKNSTRRTFIYIEVKKRGICEDDFNKAERQLESYLSSTHTATIGLVTDGDRIRAIRKKIDPNDFEYIPDIYSYGGAQANQVKLVREIPETGDKTKTGLTPISADYERLLFECHSIVRDIDGLHADEALDELSKVLYVKIYDEKTTVKKGENAEFRFQSMELVTLRR